MVWLFWWLQQNIPKYDTLIIYPHQKTCLSKVARPRMVFVEIDPVMVLSTGITAASCWMFPVFANSSMTM
jgi:hypothetical protein